MLLLLRFLLLLIDQKKNEFKIKKIKIDGLLLLLPPPPLLLPPLLMLINELRAHALVRFTCKDNTLTRVWTYISRLVHKFHYHVCRRRCCA